MFVSSFSTYVTNNTSEKTDKIAKTRENGTKSQSELFSSKLTKNVNSSSLSKPNTPINYISQSNAQHNKQMIELSQKSIQSGKKSDFKTTNDITKSFSSNASIQSAKVAYSSNSTMFSLLKKPTATIDQTPKNKYKSSSRHTGYQREKHASHYAKYVYLK